MSEDPKKGAGGEPDDGAEAGSLPPNPVLEDALREAMESVEGGAPARGDEAAESAPEPEEKPEQEPDELAATRDRLIRLQADFENFRRRALHERRDIHQYGHENLVKDLLSTVDNLERAVDHARESEDGDLEAFLQGIELVQREFLGILEKHAIREVEALGKAFDPSVHEAMSQLTDGAVDPNTVIQVLQKGYQLRDRLLRPSKVIVAKAPEPASENEDEAAG